MLDSTMAIVIEIVACGSNVQFLRIKSLPVLSNSSIHDSTITLYFFVKHFSANFKTILNEKKNKINKCYQNMIRSRILNYVD